MAQCGLHLDDWQSWVLHQGLGEREDGKWAASEVGLLVPRQNGKTDGPLVVRALAGLFLLGEKLVVFTAHEFKTAREAFLQVKGIVESSDDLMAEVRTIPTAHGEEGIVLKDGRRLRFLARSKGSARGFSCDCLILDEAFALTSKHMSAVFPTGSAMPQRQIWYASMAGDETAMEWKRIRQRGHQGSPRLGWLEWSCEEGIDLDDRRQWAIANPALGIRLSEEAIEDEREAMTDEDFGRERLGIWSVGVRERAIADEAWLDVQDPDAVPSGRRRLAIDVLPDRSAGSIVGYGDGKVELIQQGPGVGWIAPTAIKLARKHRARVYVDKLGPAAAIAKQIEGKGVGVERLGSAQVAEACARFFDAVMEGTVAIRPHDLLNRAVVGAVKKTQGDRFVWNRAQSHGDVTPLVAASLAFGADEEGEDFFEAV